MPRWLRVLVVVCTLALASGLPAFVEACADDCAEACPPSCHGCLCRAPYATSPAPAAVRAATADPELLAVPLITPAPQSPPPRGVFHPPRRSA